jgi:hypothetical protein
LPHTSPAFSEGFGKGLVAQGKIVHIHMPSSRCWELSVPPPFQNSPSRHQALSHSQSWPHDKPILGALLVHRFFQFWDGLWQSLANQNILYSAMEVPSALGLLWTTCRFLDSWSRVVLNSCNEFADVLLAGRLGTWKIGPSRSSSYLQYYVAKRMAEHTAKTIMMVVWSEREQSSPLRL